MGLHQTKFPALNLAMLVMAVVVTSMSRAAGQTQKAAVGDRPWQQQLLCPPNNSSAAGSARCSSNNAALLQTYRPLLVESQNVPVVRVRSGSTAFLLLARYLKPREANIQFAQAFCVSRGGGLAYWTTEKEYSDMAQAALQLAAKSKSKWHFYMGMVQKPNSQEPSAGWTWLHDHKEAAAQFPWAKGEPNQHNGASIKDHTEDCTVIATYHGQKAKNLVDDFPCNYADSNGKYMANGWNPQLSVACRLTSGQ